MRRIARGHHLFVGALIKSEEPRLDELDLDFPAECHDTPFGLYYL